jgi:hypothetical protein
MYMEVTLLQAQPVHQRRTFNPHHVFLLAWRHHSVQD